MRIFRGDAEITKNCFEGFLKKEKEGVIEKQNEIIKKEKNI